MTEPVRLRIALPLPLDVVATMTRLAGAVYPGATIRTDDARHLTIVIPDAERTRKGSLKAAKAAKVCSEDPEQEGELVRFHEDGVTVSTPEAAARALAEWAAVWIDAFPDVENYLEQQVTHEDGRRFTFAVCRSKEQTPHQLRQQAEAEVERLRARIAELEATR